MIFTQRDALILELIERHGPLPSHYLYELTKPLARDRFFLIKRLKKLTDERYLNRPPQLNNPLIFTDFKVYTLTDKGREALTSLGKANSYATPVGGGYQHSFMASCITANIELGCRDAGLEYISQEAILTRDTCPAETRAAEKPLSLAASIEYDFKRANGTTYRATSKRPTEPDQLFGIKYPNGYRFFALEADRGTEPLTRGNLNENSILRKILSYKSILISGEYKRRFGIPNLYPMFVTTAQDRVKNMLALARAIYPNGSHALLFKAVPGFHAYVRTPPLLPQLFTDPYERTEDAFNISKA